MKKFLEEIKGVKKLEWLLLIAAVSAIVLIGLGETHNLSEYRSEDEKRLISALKRIDGIGNTDALITDNAEGPCVLVIAEGAEDIDVYLYIQRVAQTIVGCEINDIEIVPHRR